MDNLMVSLWGYRSGADGVLIFGGGAATTIDGSYVLVAMGKCMVDYQKWYPNLHNNIVG